MASSQKLLEGEVVNADFNDSEVARLRDELRRVAGERDALKREVIGLRQRVNQIDGPAASLRQNLEPLYRVLQAIFGDIEVIDPSEATAGAATGAAGGPVTTQANAVWESWKRRLGPSAAKVITALQEHGELNTTQLSIVAQMDTRTVNAAIYKMNKASLIGKNAGRFSLKQI